MANSTSTNAPIAVNLFNNIAVQSIVMTVDSTAGGLGCHRPGEVASIMATVHGLVGMTIKTTDRDGIILDYRLEAGIPRFNIAGAG